MVPSGCGGCGDRRGAGGYVSFHRLRHTFRSRLNRAEVRQAIAMEGGRNEMVAELSHHGTESLRDAIGRLD